ncbi:MAG: hypothetical protein WCE63_19535 [Acidobacteriaceae bacterium]
MIRTDFLRRRFAGYASALLPTPAFAQSALTDAAAAASSSLLAKRKLLNVRLPYVRRSSFRILNRDKSTWIGDFMLLIVAGGHMFSLT